MVKNAPELKGGVYLLYGKEEFLKKEFIQKLRLEQTASESALETGFEQFEIPENSLGAAIDFLQNASFFAARKLAVIQGIDELEADDRQRLLGFIENLTSTSTLVLVSKESSPKKSVFLKNISEKSKQIACHLPFDKDLPQWVEQRFKKNGKTIDRETANLLIERTGKDAALLDTAVEQLAVYVNTETKISLKHVEALLGRSVQADAFRLIDFLLERKLRSALEGLEVLLGEGARIYEVIGALAGQTERLSRARLLMDEGFPSDAIAAELRLHPFFAGRILEQAQRIPKARFQTILKDLLDCDEAVKTGKMNDRLALQQLFLKICIF